LNRECHDSVKIQPLVGEIGGRTALSRKPEELIEHEIRQLREDG
jgi:hypothetical protein